MSCWVIEPLWLLVCWI